ncbi:DUF6877 family protein [Bacillus cereus]|uniref:DUF6877 family protein n=1 Tax=Bacillus cereus TaxID=1396 RepID=UPI0005A3487A|nr:DUF6877 family protein [Bacillus cereus]AJG61076.1 hypothetical protein AW22_2197 [Bacillus cereus D17]QKI15110.1 hypothetical protein FOC91_25030 [Bacillus cereus]
MSYLERISQLVSEVMLVVLQDINNSIKDWIVSGEKENAPYIEQQLRFVERVAARSKKHDI